MKHHLVVSKFGGTSVGHSTAIRRSTTLCTKNNSSLVVVLATSVTTNSLEELAKMVLKGSLKNSKSIVNQVIKHLDILYQELDTLSKGMTFF